MKTFTISFFIVLCIVFIFHLNGEAQIIHVPADYPTIQDGIIGAEPGDTVLVADGIYYENISFLGKKHWIVISHNAIYDNTAVTKYGQAAGGGIYDSYNARVEGNVISGNNCFATTDGWSSGGGFSNNAFDGGAPNTLII